MRLLGVLEVSSGWHSEAKHARAIFNVAAGISCWDRAFVILNLRAVRPDSFVAGVGFEGRRNIYLYSMLASDVCGAPLRPRLNAFIRGIWARRYSFGLPIFLQYCSVTMSNMCQLF